MNRRKKVVGILLFITLLTATTGLVGCTFGCNQAESSSNESVVDSSSQIVATVPDIAGVTADVVERPSGIYTNGCELLNVYVDGEEIPDTHYVTRNGRFILAYETYGDELSVGEYEVKLVFKQGEASYKLTVVDEADPICSFSPGEIKKSYVKGDVLQMPLVVRLNDYQTYDSVYAVYNEHGTIEQTYTNLEMSEGAQEIVWDSVGSYTVEVSLKRGDQTVKTFNAWKFETQPFAGASMFSEANIGVEGWVSGTETNTVIVYNSETKNLEFQNKVDGAMRSDQTTVSYPVSVFEMAKKAGYKALSFGIKPNETMAATTWWNLPTADNKNAWNSVSSAGLRIFGATKRVDFANKIRHNYVVWENDVNYINRGDQGDGVYVYRDVYVTEMSTQAYTQVVIDIDEFLSLGEDVEYMSFVIGSVKGGILSVGNLKWMTQEEFKAYEMQKIANDKVAYTSKNYVAEDMLYRWGVHKDSANITRSYDLEVGALKATINTDGGHSKSQKNIFALGALDIRYAYETLKFTHLTVKWKASKEMLNPETETLGTGRCVRLYTSISKSVPGGIEINLPDLSTSWTTFEISLKDLLETKNAQYLCFVIGGNQGDAVWFESITLSVKQ